MKKVFKAYQNTLFTVIAALVIIGCNQRTALAQSDKGLYFLPLVPHAHNINPAHIPEYKFYIGLPFLSAVKTGFENTLRYDDILKESGDSLYLDRDYIMGKLDRKNSFNINAVEEYLSFGFRLKNNYFHFRIADVVNANVTITKNLIQLLLYGNGNEALLGKTVNLSDNAINLTYYREYSLGFSRQINPKLYVGANFKYLQGMASLVTEKSDFRFYTDPTDFTLTASSDLIINKSTPWEGEGSIDPDLLAPASNNPGFAIDLGGQYFVNDKIDASVSVLNLGSITWKKDVDNFVSKNPSNEVVFSGFDISEYFTEGEFNQDNINRVLDSIADEFEIIETHEKFKTPLPAYLNIGGNYHLTKHSHVGLLFRQQFLKNLQWTTLQIAYRHTFGNNVNLMVSNSFAKSSYLNPGIGLAANLGPVQIYILNENFIAPFMLTSSKVFVFRFGINLVFGKTYKNEMKETEIPEVIPVEE